MRALADQQGVRSVPSDASASVAALEPVKKVRKKRERFPEHAQITRTYKFAMDVSASQSALFFSVTNRLCDVRNRLVLDLAENRRINRELKAAGLPVVYPSNEDLDTRVGQWAKVDKDLKALHSHLLQNVVDRVDEGTQRWMEALKENPQTRVRPPRFKDHRKYRSFTFKQYGNGCRIQNHRVVLSKLGRFKLFDHRRMSGQPKSVTIKFQHGRWWSIVTAQVFARDWFKPLDVDTDTRPDLGGDPGLTNLLTTSDGKEHDPPKALRAALGDLRRSQRTMSRKFRVRKRLHEQSLKAGTEKRSLREIPYSNRLRDVICEVGKRHTKAANIREYGHKKLSARLEDRVRRLAMEDHSLQFMVRNRKMARLASDRAIGDFKSHLLSALGNQRYFATSNRRAGIGGNSQTCICNASVPKELKEREHRCSECGLVAPRDMVSANIVQSIAFGSVHSAFQKLIGVASESNRNLEEFSQENQRAGSPSSCAGETRMSSRRKPRAELEPAALSVEASEVLVKRKPSSFRQLRKPRGGEPTRGRQDRLELAVPAMVQTLPTAPKPQQLRLDLG